MDEHGREPLSDDALDREIAAALAVDPSPEFVARIRERVAAEAADRAPDWSWSPAWVGVAAVAIVLTVAAALWTRGVPSRVSEPHTPVVASSSEAQGEARGADAAGTRSVVDAEQPGRVAVAERGRGRLGRRDRVPRADVQISTDDAIALRQLVDAFNARRIDPSAVPVLDSPSLPLPEVEQIVVDQIALSPLVALDAQ